MNSLVLSSWLQIIRIALFPTIVWDLVAGTLLARLAFDAHFFWTLFIALLVYHGGMILNDFADRRIDAEHRRQRPIPAGKISPAAALTTGLTMLGTAIALAWWQLHAEGFQLTLILCAIVLIYDLGSEWVRRPAGPLLLALARACSLNLVAVGALGMAWGFEAVGYLASVAYSIYFLFTSRLAGYEESGTAGMRGLQYILGVALCPVILTLKDMAPPWFFLGWILFGYFLILPAFKDRYQFWEPQRVQAAVRVCLGHAPWILGLALLVKGPYWAALCAPIVSFSVGFMARKFAPE